MRRWRSKLAGWRTLLTTRRRVTPVPRRKVRLTWLARLQGLDDASVDLLRELAATGSRFERLMAHPDWPALIDLKDELQALATETTRSASATDAQRREGAASYWALEGFTGAMYRTVRNGQKAREALKTMVKQER